MSKVKTKLAFNLTRRQLACFGIAAAVGVPSYLLARGTLGNTGAMFLLMGVALPAFLLAMYEKDGLPLEKVVRNVIRARFLRPAGEVPAAWGEALSDRKYLCPVHPAGPCEKGGCDCKRQKETHGAGPQGLNAKGKTGRPCPPSRRSPIW